MDLILLPYAGGTAAAYNFIKDDIAPEINAIVPELAGRALRYADKMYHNIEEAVDDIFDSIKSKLGDRYVLFGHSMGAVLAYELYFRIIQENINPPKAIFFSGIVLDKTYFSPEIIHLPDNEFIRAISELGGIPEEIVNNQELIDYITPFLRNDIKIVSEYKVTTMEKIKCDVYVLNGEDDIFKTSEMISWDNYCEKTPEYHTFSGEHFFVRDHHKEIAELINSINRSKGGHMDKILKIINKYAEHPITEAEVGNICMKDLGINSLNYIKIIVEIETEFDIEFDDDMLIDNNVAISDFISNVMDMTDN